ncbi:hypothetical protein NFA74_001974, partial [Campylobacter coli]|nr:hypothetical protein [Campylobacter coli]
IKQQYQDKINWNKDQNKLLFKELRKLLVPTNKSNETFEIIFLNNGLDKEILEPSICFQGLISVKKEEISDYARVASISYPFLKDIIAKFSRYYARQGSPEIIEELK